MHDHIDQYTLTNNATSSPLNISNAVRTKNSFVIVSYSKTLDITNK